MAKTHIKLWIIMLFLMVFVVPIILSPSTARQRLDDEYTSSVAIFGAERVGSIVGRANTVFDGIIGGLGIDKLIQSGYVTNKDIQGTIGAGLNREASTVTNTYLQTMMLQIYGVFFRGSLMLQWLLYIGFFLVAVFMDGFAQRRIKVDSFQMISPIKFAIAMHSVIASFFAPVAYLMLPIAVTPWFMPIWALIIAVPVSKAIANAAKMG